MPLQVNARMDDSDWERIVAAMPGQSNAERLTRIVRHHLTLLDAQHDLASALDLVESILDPALQSLKHQRLRGHGSEIVEELTRCTTEMAAIILALTRSVQTAPEKHLAELEIQLVRRWSQSTLYLLRTAALDSTRICGHQGVLPELRRIQEQATLLASTSVPSPNPSKSTPNPT